MQIGNVKLFPTYGKQLIKSELIEVIIPASSKGIKPKIQLPNNANLRNSFLWHIETFTDQDITTSPISRTALIRNELFLRTFLTLQGYQGDNFQWTAPLIDFRTMRNLRLNATPGNSLLNTETQPDNFTAQKVNWPKSYIEVSDTTYIQDFDQAVLFEVYYSEFRAEEIKDKAASYTNRS